MEVLTYFSKDRAPDYKYLESREFQIMITFLIIYEALWVLSRCWTSASKILSDGKFWKLKSIHLS